MKVKSQNHMVLDKYFDGLVKDGIEIPFITSVSTVTGISAATITRYARGKGYYGYPDMRSNLLKSINKPEKANHTLSNNALKFISFLQANDKIAICTSVSANPIGVFLVERLKTLKTEVYKMENMEALPAPEFAVIAITISGESAKIAKLMESKGKFHDFLVISCDETPEKEKAIVLSEFMYKTRKNIELFRSMILMNNWLQEVIDLYQAN